MVDLPVAHDDEDFWRGQEKRRQRLQQPCCTQSNMSWAMIDMPGNFAVVIHGESDCLNCFFHHGGRNAASYFSTRLTDLQLTTGDTHRPLRHLLSLIAKERRPDAVIVLGTCPVEVIGDRFETVVEAVAEETGVPMVALHTHGLSLTTLTRCQDWLYATLAALPQRAEPTPGVNLIGLPPEAPQTEVGDVLRALGVRVHGFYPNDTSLDAWRTIAGASHGLLVDRTMYTRLGKQLERYGQELLEVPLPIGPEHTARFYEIAAGAFGAEARLGDALAEHASAHEQAMEALAERARGVRLALCIRMLKTHRSDKLAYEGMADYSLLRALGFEIEVLVQGPPEEGARAAFGKRLAEIGYGDVPVDVFPGPWKLGEMLQAKKMQVALMSDVARNVAEAAGVQMIPNGSFRPFYAGMSHNLAVVSRVLDGIR